MPPKKRSSDGATSAAKRRDKIAQFHAALPKTGVPPPTLPPLPPMHTIDNTRGYRKEWIRYANAITECFSDESDRIINGFDVRDYIEWERAAFAADQTDGDRLRDVGNLIRGRDDFYGPTDDDRAHYPYDHHCAGCNRMDERRAAGVDRRWRLVGTRHHFCHVCHNNIKAGRRVEIAHPYSFNAPT